MRKLLFTLVALPLPAWAGDARLDVPVAGRGLTIGRLNLELGVEPGLIHFEGTNAFTATLPLRFGITNDLEIFASPILQSVDPILHEPALGAVYRLIDGPAEVGVRVASNLALFGDVKSAEFQVGVPVRIHAGGVVALDLGAHLLLPVVPDVTVGVQVPFGLTLNPVHQVFVGASSALRIPDLSDVDASLVAPLTAQIGYTIAKNQPIADIGARADWADIQTPSDGIAIGGFARIFLYP